MFPITGEFAAEDMLGAGRARGKRAAWGGKGECSCGTVAAEGLVFMEEEVGDWGTFRVSYELGSGCAIGVDADV